MSNLMPEGGTLKKSMTNLTHSPIIPAVIQRRKEKKKSLQGPGILQPSPNADKSPDEESMSSVASEATLKAEPIPKVKVSPKYIKNQKNNHDTLTYRRQRRVGVHFSPSIMQPESDV